MRNLISAYEARVKQRKAKDLSLIYNRRLNEMLTDVVEMVLDKTNKEQADQILRIIKK